MNRLHLLPPVGYLEFLSLMDSARAVLTDSGGIQEETTALGVPCLTLRDNTERPITITEGTNRLVGSAPQQFIAAVQDVLSSPMPAACHRGAVGRTSGPEGREGPSHLGGRGGRPQPSSVD